MVRGQTKSGRTDSLTEIVSGGKFRWWKNALAKTWGVRGGGPILHNGIEAVGFSGTPPPRTVIGDPSQVVRTGAETVKWCCASLPSVGWTQDDTLG